MAAIKSSHLLVILIYATCLDLVHSDRNVTSTPGRASGVLPVCGTVDNIATRIQICSRPIFGLLEGNPDKWPKNTSDIIGVCHDFMEGEKCMRNVGRKCTKGLHRTVISTIANSAQRVRKRECLPSGLDDLLKMSLCLEQSKLMPNVLLEVYAKLKTIDSHVAKVHDRINSVCCVIKGVEYLVRDKFRYVCPKESEGMVRLYNSVVQDVLEVVCIRPRCNGDILFGHKVEKITDYKGIIHLMVNIIINLAR